MPECGVPGTGAIDLEVSGGTGVLNYNWSEDKLDGMQNAMGLDAGLFSVTVTDEAGCSGLFKFRT